MDDVKRKLASLRVIDDITPIDGADRIEVAHVGGWPVVVKKGDFKKGQLAIYFEIDSFIPTEYAPFLTKSGKYPSVYNGVEGERLKTIKLRGQISQGLLLPITDVYSEFNNDWAIPVYTAEDDEWTYYPAEDGVDLTDWLNVQKWERPLPTNLAGLAKGNFPHFIPKTGEVRIQNFQKGLNAEVNRGDEWEVSMKLDGTSATYFLNDGEYGVCSRNLQLKLEGNDDNLYIRTGIEMGLDSALRQIGRNVALQGELMGPRIQDNHEFLKKTEFFLFNIFDIDKQEYLTPKERNDLFLEIHYLTNSGIFHHVPRLEKNYVLPTNDINFYLDMADGESLHHHTREGLVFKRNDGKVSFKAISNKWLLEYE